MKQYRKFGYDPNARGWVVVHEDKDGTKYGLQDGKPTKGKYTLSDWRNAVASMKKFGKEGKTYLQEIDYGKLEKEPVSGNR